MAEHEIIKYTKRAYKVSRDTEKSWKERIIEVVVDVGIIVFAITLSLYLHHRSEVKRDRALEKDFLTGLREDLRKDITELREDSSTYTVVRDGFRYYLSLSGAAAKDTRPDSSGFYRFTLFNTTDPHPNISRYEGLRSSGKLYIIEDKALLNDILDLYQEKMPILQYSTATFSNFKVDRLSIYLENNLVYSDSTHNIRELLRNHVFQNYLKKHRNIGEILNRYHEAIEQCRLIINKINDEYPE